MKHREITGSLAERNGRYTAILNLYDNIGERVSCLIRMR